MPIHEFKCDEGHVTEKVFLTFGDVEHTGYMQQVYSEDGSSFELRPAIACPKCTGLAVIIDSVPAQAHLLGNPDGYYKPSPTKRHSYKHVNAHGNGAKEKR